MINIIIKAMDRSKTVMAPPNDENNNDSLGVTAVPAAYQSEPIGFWRSVGRGCYCWLGGRQEYPDNKFQKATRMGLSLLTISSLATCLALTIYYRFNNNVSTCIQPLSRVPFPILPVSGLCSAQEATLLPKRDGKQWNGIVCPTPVTVGDGYTELKGVRTTDGTRTYFICPNATVDNGGKFCSMQPKQPNDEKCIMIYGAVSGVKCMIPSGIPSMKILPIEPMYDNGVLVKTTPNVTNTCAVVVANENHCPNPVTYDQNI